MALYKKSDFAREVGLKTGNLTNYIKRGKVVIREDELIDSEDLVNADFLKKRAEFLAKKAAREAESGNLDPAPEEVNPISDPELPLSDFPPGDSDQNDEEVKRIASSGGLFGLDKMKIAADIQRIETVRDLNLLKIQKEQGEIIPTELMGPIIAQFAMSITSAFRSAADNLLTEFAHKHKIDGESESELRTKIVAITNEAVETAVDESHRAVDRIAGDYSNKRGVGQKRA
jgi:hypothetical protein